MHIFDCQDGLTFYYTNDLREVTIVDEEGHEVRNADFREFLLFVRLKDLADGRLKKGVFLGFYNTLFRYSNDLCEVIIEDIKGNRIQCQNFKDFAEMIRERDLIDALEDNDLSHLLESNKGL